MGMKAGNPLQQMLLQKLQQVNPTGYNQVANAMKTGANPEIMVKNLIKTNNIDVSQLKKQAQAVRCSTRCIK